MIKYVAGLMFNRSGEYMAVIEKRKGPDNMIGKLNGIGGKGKHGEAPIQTMVREFREETGVETTATEWRLLFHLDIHRPIPKDNDTLDIFVAFSDKVFDCKTQEEEPVFIYKTAELLHDFTLSIKLYYNMNWMIPMALDGDNISFKGHCKRS